MPRKIFSLNVKVLQEHREALQKLAAVEGETMSVTLRRLIRDAATAKGLWLDCLERNRNNQNTIDLKNYRELPNA